MTESDGRGQTIRQRPPVNLLHEEKFIDTFPKRSGMGETRPRFEGTDRPFMTESDGRGRTICQRPPVNLLHEEKFIDTFPKRSAMGETRPGFEGTDRPFMTESEGRGQTIRQRPPVNLLHEEKFIGTFPKRSRMGETRPGFEGTDRPFMAESDGRGRMIRQRPPVNLLHEERLIDTFPKRSRMGETRPGFEGTDRRFMTESDGRGRMIRQRPPVNLLHEDKFIDTFPKRSAMGETRPRFEGTDRLSMTESDGRSRMMIVHSAPAIIREVFSGFFEKDSEVEANLRIRDPAPLIAHGVPASMNKSLSSKWDNSKAFAPQISKPSFENSPPLDFAEDLDRSLAGINATASDPRRIYRRYPELEHVEPVRAKIIEEREVLRENKSEPDLGRQLIDLNLNRLSDQVYSLIEKRIRIERERRGLYG